MTDRPAPRSSGLDEIIAASIDEHHAVAGLSGVAPAIGLGDVLRRVDARRTRRRTGVAVGSFGAIGIGIVGLTLVSGTDEPSPVADVPAGASTLPTATPAPTITAKRIVPSGTEVWQCLDQIEYWGDEAVDDKFYVECTKVTLPEDSPLVPSTPVDGEPALVDRFPASTAPATPPGLDDGMVTTTTFVVPARATVHVVGAGDTPCTVALRYGVTVEELADANSGNPVWSSFVLGGELTIPDQRSGATPACMSGENITAYPQSYVAVTGDSLSKIAARFGISIDALVNFNGWDDGLDHPLLVGDVVQIPPNAVLQPVPTTTVAIDGTVPTTAPS